MSYMQKAIEHSLIITDKEGLEEFLKTELCYLENQHKNFDLKIALSEYWEDVIVYEDGVIEADESFDCWHKSDDETLDELARFITGSITWLGEDDNVWREIFRDGKRTEEAPIWPSDYFYIEKWSDKDLIGRVPDEIFGEAKKRVISAFEDLAIRSANIKNEIINDIIAELLKEKENQDENVHRS